MFRWIAIVAAIALAIGAAFAQSTPPSQIEPVPPLGQTPMMGSPMMNGGATWMDQGTMPMMQMMQMMNSGTMGPGMMGGMMGPGMMNSGIMGPGMMNAGMMGPGMMGQDMMGPMMCRGQMGMMGAAGSGASYLEARLAFVKSELAIDQSQEAEWQKYAAALRGQVKPMSTRMSGMQHAMTTEMDFPARFDAHVTMLEGHLASLKAVRDAAVGLYGQLNAEQKHKADALLLTSLCM